MTLEELNEAMPQYCRIVEDILYPGYNLIFTEDEDSETIAIRVEDIIRVESKIRPIEFVVKDKKGKEVKYIPHGAIWCILIK